MMSEDMSNITYRERSNEKRLETRLLDGPKFSVRHLS